MDSRFADDALFNDDVADEPIVRSREEKIIFGAGLTLTALCVAAYYIGRSYNAPAWVAGVEGALGMLFSQVTGQSYGGTPSWKAAFLSACKPLVKDIVLTTALIGGIGYVAYDNQHALNLRNDSPPKYQDPEQHIHRSSGDFILGFEVCEGKQKGDRVDVSKHFPDKTRWHYTICPK